MARPPQPCRTPSPTPPWCAVVEGHRLTNGLLFGLPVVLDTDSEDVAVGDRVLLTYNGEVGSLGGREVGRARSAVR